MAAGGRGGGERRGAGDGERLGKGEGVGEGDGACWLGKVQRGKGRGWIEVSARQECSRCSLHIDVMLGIERFHKCLIQPTAAPQLLAWIDSPLMNMADKGN